MAFEPAERVFTMVDFRHKSNWSSPPHLQFLPRGVLRHHQKHLDLVKSVPAS